ncbi:MAG: hypothetical protein LBI72_13025 [Flavobacteriaceae bacterium]|jgi:hypothetical protein|nr:hypothetical protein [Flavobacteriaceae bacterium]
MTNNKEGFEVPIKTRNSLHVIADCIGILCKIGYVGIGLILLVCCVFFWGLDGEGIGILLIILCVCSAVIIMFMLMKKFALEMSAAIVCRDSKAFGKCIGYLSTFFFLLTIVLILITFQVVSVREDILNEDNKEDLELIDDNQ